MYNEGKLAKMLPMYNKWWIAKMCICIINNSKVCKNAANVIEIKYVKVS